MTHRYASEEHRRLASAIRAAVRLCNDPNDARAALAMLRNGRPVTSAVLPRRYSVSADGGRVLQIPLVRGKYSANQMQPSLRGQVLFSSSDPEPGFFLGEIVWIDHDLGGRHLGFLSHKPAGDDTQDVLVKHRALGTQPTSIPAAIMVSIHAAAMGILIERALPLQIEPDRTNILIAFQVMRS